MVERTETAPNASLTGQLTPVLYLKRSAGSFPERVAVIDGDVQLTYREFADRSHRLVGVLRDAGIEIGDRVAALCANSHVMLEMHNGVPLAGAVLVPLNFRLGLGELKTIIEHSGARLIVATTEFATEANELAELCAIPAITEGDHPGSYDDLIAHAERGEIARQSELALLAINYTSGSTGQPKGVMYNHRGAYLQALAMAYHLELTLESSYLWTLPMFHCDGWCHTWAVTAAAATHVCLRNVDPDAIWEIISSGSITHLSGAPTVLTMIAQAAERSTLGPPDNVVRAATGGAPPTPALLARTRKLNLLITHLYGLTETYGPAVVNQWQPEWSSLDDPTQAALNARQGIGNIVTVGMRVVDGEGKDVPRDGVTIGEIVIQGNNVTPGYYRDEAATAAAIIDGWLHTGDLAVCHPDGYVEMRDRAKDIVITGGENVPSLEVERVLCDHTAVLEAAVVARPDDFWGEVPVAFVTLRSDASITAEEIIAFAKERLTHFKVPRQVIFAELPKTSTGKVQKHVLRDQLKVMISIAESPS